MNTRKRKIAYGTIVALLVVGGAIAQRGFAWTNPSSNPPLGSKVINISGNKVGVGTTNPFGVLESSTDLDIPAVRGYSTGASGVGVNGESTASGAGAGVSAKGWRGVYAESTDLTGGWAGYFLGRGYFSGNVGVGTTGLDTNYRITTSGGGIKAGNSSATQPAGYFSNGGGGPAITIGTGGITLGGVNQTSWPTAGGTEWTTSGTNIYNTNTGNVGIGTTNPQNELHIFTTLPAGGLDIDGTASNSIVRFKNNGTTKAFVGIANSAGAVVNGSAANDTAIRFDGGNLLFGYGATEMMRVTSAGNVGIGVATPAAKLDVSGEVVSNVIGAGGGNIRMIGGNYGAFFRNDGTNTYLLLTASGSQFGSWNALRPFYVNNTTGEVTLGQSTKLPLGIWNASGNIGVGTTLPDANYKITTTAGGIKAENSSATQPAGYFNNAGGGPAITAGTGGITLGGVNQTAWPAAGGTEWTTSGLNIYNANTGNVGIGTTAPGRKLTIAAGTTGSNIVTTDYAQGTTGTEFVQYLGANTGSTFGALGVLINGGTSYGNLILQLGGGNVGVGTNAPVSKFQVASGYLQVPAVTTYPAAADCDTLAETGRMVVFNSTLVGSGNLAVCVQRANVIGWRSL